MEIPKDVQTYEMYSSIIWIKEGIMFSTPKDVKKRELTSAEMDKDISKFKSIVGNERICMVVELNPGYRPSRKEERDLIAEEINKIARAMALITNSPVTRMIANLFLGFRPAEYPVKMFSNEADAIKWIKQYL